MRDGVITWLDQAKQCTNARMTKFERDVTIAHQAHSQVYMCGQTHVHVRPHLDLATDWRRKAKYARHTARHTAAHSSVLSQLHMDMQVTPFLSMW